MSEEEQQIELDYIEVFALFNKLILWGYSNLKGEDWSKLVEVYSSWWHNQYALLQSENKKK